MVKFMEDLPGAFAGELLSSDTFWQQTVVYLAGALLCALGLALLIIWRWRNAGRPDLRELHKAETGAAVAVDFTLTIPIFMSLILFMIQLALMANASLVVHYAAFNGARAAKVWMVEKDHGFAELDCCGVSVISAVDSIVGFAGEYQGDDETAKRVRVAVSVPLISISPANPRFGPRNPGNAWKQTEMTQFFNTIRPQSKSMLVRKAQYAFDETNTKITYGLLNQDLFVSGMDLLGIVGDVPIGSIASLPVHTEVSFRYTLIIPLAAALFNNDDSQPYARLMTARVSLK